MKHRSSRVLLSLLLILTMVFSMVPVAAAAGTPTISASANEVTVGENFTVSVNPASSTDTLGTVTWNYDSTLVQLSTSTSASNGGVGYFKAVSPGTATISATLFVTDASTGTAEAVTTTSVSVQVVAAAETITLSATTLSMSLNGTASLTATTNATSVTWSSSNTSIVSYVDLGKTVALTAVGTGTALITATVGNVSASCTVTVSAVTTGLYLNYTTLDLSSGSGTVSAYQDANLTSLASGASWTLAVTSGTFSFSQTGIALITTGSTVTVYASGTGSATLTASYNGVTKTCYLTANSTSGFSISQSSLTIAAGSSSTVSATWYSTPVIATWTLTPLTTASTNMFSFASSVVTTSTTGSSVTVYTLGTGSATLTATYTYGSAVYTKYCTVTSTGSGLVLTKSGVAVTSVPITVGSYDTITATVNGVSVSGVTWTLTPTTTASTGMFSFASSASAVTTTTTGSSVTVYARGSGSATLTATYGTYTASCTVTTSVLSVTSTSFSLTGATNSLVYCTNLTSYAGSNIRYVWYSSNPSVVQFDNSYNYYSSTETTVNYVRVYSTGYSGYSDITVQAYIYGVSTSSNPTYIGSNTCRVTVNGSTFTATATVYDNNTYTLSDLDDANSSYSVVDQIVNAFYSNVSSAYRSNMYVKFSNVSSTYGSLSAVTTTPYYISAYSTRGTYYLDDVVFTPKVLSSSTSQVATFNFTVYSDYYYTGYSGTLTITVKQGSSTTSNIAYAATSGDSVEMQVEDFQDFWTSLYSRGTLKYVTFTSVSSGRLKNSDGNSLSVGTSGTACYVSPSSSQTGLTGVTYTPSSSSASSVTIRFTAVGTTSSSSTTTTSRSGVVTITYVKEAANPIQYNLTSTSATVTLDEDDFTDLYKTVTGSNSTNVQIKFTSLPASGTLKYNSTTLTASNISSYTFSAKSSGSNRINNLVYTPGASGGTETATFNCYNGTTLRFRGTIRFVTAVQKVTGVSVSYACSSADGVSFDSTKFSNSNTAVKNCSYIIFGTPSSGSLVMGSTAVTSSTHFSLVETTGCQLISTVTYRPATGYNGTATIPFTAYNSSGTAVAEGTVTVSVTQSTTTTTPDNDNATNTTPTININTVYSDVDGHWATNEIAALTQAGILEGNGNGKFRPNDDTTLGEALKMIMMSAGYSKQYQPTGRQWAINYLVLAVNDKLLTGTSADYDLNAAVDRNTIARVAALAMDLSPATNVTSPFTDSNDPYVLALYQIGVIKGNGNGTYNGTRPLTRAELCAIVYRIYNYNDTLDTTTTPTTSSTTTTTTTPTTTEPEEEEDNSTAPGWLNS